MVEKEQERPVPEATQHTHLNSNEESEAFSLNLSIPFRRFGTRTHTTMQTHSSIIAYIFLRCEYKNRDLNIVNRC